MNPYESLGPSEEVFGELLEAKTIDMPSGGLFVNLDVNDFLADGHSEAELLDLVGKLKDVLRP